MDQLELIASAEMLVGILRPYVSSASPGTELLSELKRFFLQYSGEKFTVVEKGMKEIDETHAFAKDWLAEAGYDPNHLDEIATFLIILQLEEEHPEGMRYFWSTIYARSIDEVELATERVTRMNTCVQ